jgi:hypothetical protein
VLRVVPWNFTSLKASRTLPESATPNTVAARDGRNLSNLWSCLSGFMLKPTDQWIQTSKPGMPFALNSLDHNPPWISSFEGLQNGHPRIDTPAHITSGSRPWTVLYFDFSFSSKVWKPDNFSSLAFHCVPYRYSMKHVHSSIQHHHHEWCQHLRVCVGDLVVWNELPAKSFSAFLWELNG